MKIILLTIFILLITYILVWFLYKEHLYRKKRKKLKDDIKNLKL